MWKGSGSKVVLVIDDDDQVRATIRARLEASSFDVVDAASGEEGLRHMTDDIDVVIVDIGLPGIDGFAVVRAIRERRAVPIIIVTAEGAESDRVLGLEIGADDYVVKPVLPRELVARVQALLRRTAVRIDEVPTVDHHVRFRDVVVDGVAREVRRADEVLSLTHREFDLLWFLVSSPRQAFSREQLLRQVWNTEPGWQQDSTVTEHAHRLRRHIELDPSRPQHLVTVRGVGYRFDP